MIKALLYGIALLGESTREPGEEPENGGYLNASKKPVTICSEKSRLQYDIVIPFTKFRYRRKYDELTRLDLGRIPTLHTLNCLNIDRKEPIKILYPKTNSQIREMSKKPSDALQKRELISRIASDVAKRAHITNAFCEIYPLTEAYIIKKAFAAKIRRPTDRVLVHFLGNKYIREEIVDILSKELSKPTAGTREIVLRDSPLKLSDVQPFVWRGRHLRCDRTVFNFVAVCDDFQAEFVQFLWRCPDIARFAALAGLLCIGYIGSRGNALIYSPDFVAIQDDRRNQIRQVFWLIGVTENRNEKAENKNGNEADAVMQDWCSKVSRVTKQTWRHLRIPQSYFDGVKNKVGDFSGLLSGINSWSGHGAVC